jgi:hypothetical protein
MARKYGIWKTRYVSKNVFEGWVQINNEPVLFESERGALEYMHDIENKHRWNEAEYEVRRYAEVVLR